METLEDLKAIIKNAPDIATLVDIADDGEIDYMYHVMENESGEKILSCSNDDDAAIEYSDGNIRSLSDIKRIIELMEQIAKVGDVKDECKHIDKITHLDHNQCKSCGYVLTDGGFGCASNKWFANIETAKFYQKNGFLPSGAYAVEEL